MAAIAAALVALGAGAALLPLGGMWTDEAVHGLMAVDWLQEGFSPGRWPWGPWMKDSYQGSIKTALLAASFSLFGVSPQTARSATLALGALAALLFVLFAGRRYGSLWAGIFGALVAGDPALIAACVYDTGPVAVSLALKAAALWLLDRSGRSPRPGPWRFAAGAALGLCVWDKSHSLWLVLASPAALWLLPARARLRGGLQFLTGVAAGASPWIVFNLAHPLITFRDPGHQGVPLLSHLRGLPHWAWERLDWTRAAFTGEGILPYVSGSSIGPCWGWRLKAALAALAAIALLQRGGKSLREGAAEALRWGGFTSAAFAFAALSPMPVKWHHMMVLWPFPQLAIVALLREAWGPRPGRRAGAALALACSAALALDLAALASFAGDMRRSRGGRVFAEAAGEAARWLSTRLERAPGTVLLCGAALEAPLAVHSGGQLRCALDQSALLRDIPSAARTLAEGALLWTSPGLKLDGWTREDPWLARMARHVQTETLAVFRDGRGEPWLAVFRARSRDPRELARALRQFAADAGEPGPDDARGGGRRRAAGDRAQAPETLEAALAAERDAETRRAIALAFQEIGMAARAVDIFGADLARDPDNSRRLQDRGVALALAGREEEALADLRRALELEPRSPETRVTLAGLLLRRGRREEALAALGEDCQRRDIRLCAAWRDLRQRAQRGEDLGRVRVALEQSQK